MRPQVRQQIGNPKTRIFWRKLRVYCVKAKNTDYQWLIVVDRRIEPSKTKDMDEQQNIIIYRTADGRASVALYAKDGKIWLNQQQMAELFATSKQTISHHVINILKEKELNEISVVKEYLTTAADGKNYNVVWYRA